MNQKIILHHAPPASDRYSFIRVTLVTVDANGLIENKNDNTDKGFLERVKHNDILYIATSNKGNHNNSVIYLEDKEKRTLKVRNTMKNLISMLPADMFVQINSSFIVNINCINGFIPPNIICMKDFNLIVGRKYLPDVLQKLFHKDIFITSYECYKKEKKVLST